MGSDNVKVLFQIRVVASCGEGLIDTVMGSLLTRCLGAVFCLYNNSTASGTTY